MIDVLSNKELVSAIQSNKMIIGGIVENCEEIKYDFRIGDKILKAAFKRPVDYSLLTVEEKAKCEVAPGEVVFVMTEEKLNLPNDIFCQLSNKRTIGHGGIVVLGGLMIDPNYSGHLIFGLYNVSSVPYPINPGKKLAAGVFYRTDSITDSNPSIVPESLEDFPDALVLSMSKYTPFSPTNATVQIDLMQQRIAILESKINSDNEWKVTFKGSLDSVGTKLEDIADKLSNEISARQEGQVGLEKQMAVLRGIGLVLSGLLGGGLVSLLVMWIAGILHIG